MWSIGCKVCLEGALARLNVQGIAAVPADDLAPLLRLLLRLLSSPAPPELLVIICSQLDQLLSLLDSDDPDVCETTLDIIFETHVQGQVVTGDRLLR